MKKILTVISAAIAAVVIAVLFAACSSNYVGTYKFSSMKMDMGGAIIEVKAGEEFQGMTLTEDYMVLEIKDGDTWTMTTMGSGSESGTWKTEGDNIILTDSSGESITATLSGNTLTISQTQDGMTVTIVMVK